MDKEQIKHTVESLLQEMAVHNKKQIELEKRLVEVFPVKEGEKVNVVKEYGNSEVIVRQAFVTRVKVNYRGVNREARIEFDLAKCRRDGNKGSMSDHLAYYEYIRKINK